jgi:sporulation protein YlmC with PRC-barrel domain
MKHLLTRAGRQLAVAGVTAVAVAGFLALEPSRAPAQDVALVKVDVSVLATGYRASKLIGSGVVNDKNEKIGNIDDLVINQDKVMAAVLQVGGFLGIASRRVAVPYDHLQIDEANHKIVLPGATKDELRKMAEVQS